MWRAISALCTAADTWQNPPALHSELGDLGALRLTTNARSCAEAGTAGLEERHGHPGHELREQARS